MRTLTLLLAMAALAAAADPTVCELAAGESCAVTAGGKQKTVRLLGLRELTEPYFESSKGDFCDAVVRAEVSVEVDGVRGHVIGGPFRLPQPVNGVNLLVATTRGWLDGVVPDQLSKDVRLEAKDAAQPFYAPGRFVFPIRNYRWHAMNYQHTWLGLAVNQAVHYYHRGEDMGMIPDLEEVVSMTAATVKTVPGPRGDNASNGFVTRDASGLEFRYAHMNAPHIRGDLQPGIAVKQGEKLGLTGNTWRGRPVSDPHLHVDIGSGGVFRNTFPIIVNAYQTSYPAEILAVAGGWRHVWAGEEAELDASLSIAPPGGRIASFEWTFSDGKRASGERVRRSYPAIGAFSEHVRVNGNRGRSADGFVEVFVLDRKNRKAPPYIWMNYHPVRGIRPGTEVGFLTRFSNTRDVVIDFGDGVQVPHERDLRHSYSRPGTYIVTARGADSGSGPAVFKVRVVVE